MISGNSMILASVGNMVKDRTKAGQSSPEFSKTYCFLQIFNLFLDRCFSYVIIEKMADFGLDRWFLLEIFTNKSYKKALERVIWHFVACLGPLVQKKKSILLKRNATFFILMHFGDRQASFLFLRKSCQFLPDFVKFHDFWKFHDFGLSGKHGKGQDKGWPIFTRILKQVLFFTNFQFIPGSMFFLCNYRKKLTDFGLVRWI